MKQLFRGKIQREPRVPPGTNSPGGSCHATYPAGLDTTSGVLARNYGFVGLSPKETALPPSTPPFVTRRQIGLHIKSGIAKVATTNPVRISIGN